MKFRAVTSDKRTLDATTIALINQYASRWQPGTALEVEVKRRAKVSNPQRRFYFAGVLPALLEACGYDPEDAMQVHRQLKILFFHVQPDERGIYRERDIPSVFSNAPTVEPSQRTKFVDWVIRKAVENGAEIDDP